MSKLISKQDGSRSDYYVKWDNGFEAYLGCTNPGGTSVGGVKITASEELIAVIEAEQRFIDLAKNLPTYSGISYSSAFVEHLLPLSRSR